MLLLAAAPDPANAPHHPAPSWGDPTAQYSWERGGLRDKTELKNNWRKDEGQAGEGI